MELGGDEHLIPRHTAFAQPPANALLVAVELRGINVAIANLQRPAYGIDGFRTIGHLPDAETKQRDLVTVRERPHTPLRELWMACHSTCPPLSAQMRGTGGPIAQPRSPRPPLPRHAWLIQT